MLQDVVEQNLEIIREAMNSILNIMPDINISNTRRLVDVRNTITYGYDENENTQIWV